MADTAPHPAAGDVTRVPYLERFEVYRVALSFQELIPQLLPRRAHRDLRNQLERASASVVLNIAEGLGRYSRPDKAHFYRIANGSVFESEAAIDILMARKLIDPARHSEARALLMRTGQMLTKLILRMQA